MSESDSPELKFKWVEEKKEKCINWSLPIYPEMMDRINKVVGDLKENGNAVSAPKLVRRMINECLSQMGYPKEK